LKRDFTTDKDVGWEKGETFTVTKDTAIVWESLQGNSFTSIQKTDFCGDVTYTKLRRATAG
jgi:hypothetical protein